MNSSQYKEYYDQAVTALDNHRVGKAIRLARTAMSEASSGSDDFRQLLRGLDRLGETYHYLSAYALDGYSDPTRSDQIASIGRRLLGLMRLGEREIEARDSSRQYYSTLRFHRRHREQTILSLIEDCRKAAGICSRLNFAGDTTTSAMHDALIALESSERYLFDRIWVTSPLSNDDIEAIRTLLNDDVFGDRIKSMVVGALFLGLLDHFDPARVILLLDAYGNKRQNVSVRALAMLPVALTMTDRRALAEAVELRPRFEALAEDPGWRRDVTEVFRQLLTSRDTERITRKMNEEIIPSMRNISEGITEIIKDRSVQNPESLEDDEQWSRLLEDTRVSENMRKLSEMQESGSDIMMTTFGHLKDFPFFREISNWFIPFDPDHTSVTSNQAAINVAEMLVSSPLLCDSDKYSMIFSLSRVPEQQKEFLAEQMAAQTSQMAELRAASMDRANDSRVLALTGAVRDLYRFFRLYGRASEFVNPFDTPLNLMSVPVLRDTIDREGLLKLAADFYFTHGYYEDALPMLADLESDVSPESTAELYYRMGVCYRYIGDSEKALVYLERSELFDDSRESTLIELGQCYRAVGNHRKSYEYFKRANAMHEEGDHNLQLQMAAELIELERYDEALRLLYRLEYLYGLSPAFARRMIMCEMMTGRFDKCRGRLDRLDRTTVEDLVYLAAIEVAEGHYRTAVDRLRTAVCLAGGDQSCVFDRFDRLEAVMRRGGADRLLIDIIKDNVK